MFCPNCGAQVSDNTNYCNICGFALQTQAPPVYTAPVAASKRRPTGVTVIGVLLIIAGSIGMISAFLQRGNFVLGVLWISGPVAILYSLLLAGIGLGCGIGFIRQRAFARQLFMVCAAYTLLSNLLSLTQVDRALYLTAHQDLYGSALVIARIIAYGGIVVALAVWTLMLSYVVKHKDYFPN